MKLKNPKSSIQKNSEAALNSSFVGLYVLKGVGYSVLVYRDGIKPSDAKKCFGFSPAPFHLIHKVVRAASPIGVYFLLPNPDVWVVVGCVSTKVPV